MIKLYRHPISGHAHRAELMLSLLDIPHELIDVDLLKGEQRASEFLALNPFGQVPVIDDEGTIISDSNAILVYLARKYGNGDWLPKDAVGASAVQKWLSVAAGAIATGPALARLVVLFKTNHDHEAAKQVANKLFAQMDQVLSDHTFLVGEHATIADVAGYSYIAHAPEGGVSLDPYPHIRVWLSRIESLKGFVPMQKTDVNVAA